MVDVMPFGKPCSAIISNGGECNTVFAIRVDDNTAGLFVEMAAWNTVVTVVTLVVRR